MERGVSKIGSDLELLPGFDQYILHTWSPNDPCVGWKRPCFGALTFKNRGHLGSR